MPEWPARWGSHALKIGAFVLMGMLMVVASGAWIASGVLRNWIIKTEAKEGDDERATR